MNISPVNNNQSNINFGALKSIRFSNKFKGQPKLQTQLLDSFEKSEAMRKFCKRFDVAIDFYVSKVLGGKMLAMMHVVYATRPTRKLDFLDKFFAPDAPYTSQFVVEAEDYVSSLEETTGSLCKKIAESSEKFEEKIKKLEKHPEKIAAQDAFELAQKEEAIKKEKLDSEQAIVDKRIENIIRNQ